MSERHGLDPEKDPSPDPDRPVVPYSGGVGPGEREPLTKRQRWLVLLFFVPPLVYLAVLIVRSMVQQ